MNNPFSPTLTEWCRNHTCNPTWNNFTTQGTEVSYAGNIVFGMISLLLIILTIGIYNS